MSNDFWASTFEIPCSVFDIRHSTQMDPANKNELPGSVPLITFENITIRVRDQFILAGTSWTLKNNQHWAVIGPNGAGKSSFVRAIAGELPVVQGKITYHAGKSFRRRICYVSFELQQRLIASEEARDESRYFSGKLNNMTTARDLICTSQSGVEGRRTGLQTPKRGNSREASPQNRLYRWRPNV